MRHEARQQRDPIIDSTLKEPKPSAGVRARKGVRRGGRVAGALALTGGLALHATPVDAHHVTRGSDWDANGFCSTPSNVGEPGGRIKVVAITQPFTYAVDGKLGVNGNGDVLTIIPGQPSDVPVWNGAHDVTVFPESHGQDSGSVTVACPSNEAPLPTPTTPPTEVPGSSSTVPHATSIPGSSETTPPTSRSGGGSSVASPSSQASQENGSSSASSSSGSTTSRDVPTAQGGSVEQATGSGGVGNQVVPESGGNEQVLGSSQSDSNSTDLQAVSSGSSTTGSETNISTGSLANKSQKSGSSNNGGVLIIAGGLAAAAAGVGIWRRERGKVGRGPIDF